MKGCLSYLLIALLIGGVFLMIIFEHVEQDAQRFSPQRPHTVPPDAVWVGGVDGGDWLQCKPTDHRLYECQIFSEGSGNKRSSGKYCFEGTLEAANLKYTAYDGESIYVKGGTLIPIGDHLYYYETIDNETNVVSYPQKTCP